MNSMDSFMSYFLYTSKSILNKSYEINEMAEKSRNLNLKTNKAGQALINANKVAQARIDAAVIDGGNTSRIRQAVEKVRVLFEPEWQTGESEASARGMFDRISKAVNNKKAVFKARIDMRKLDGASPAKTTLTALTTPINAYKKSNFLEDNEKIKAFSGGISNLSKVAGNATKILDFMGNHGVAVSDNLKNAVQICSTGFMAMESALTLAGTAQTLFNLAASACPITLIIIGIAALIAIIVELVKHWDSVKAAVAGVWDSIIGVFGNIAAWFKTNVIDPLLKLLPGWLKKLLGIGGGANINISANGKPDGSKACGLSYVPFDGYVAELHKGERVLTASENRSYSNPARTYGKGNTASGGNNFNITINGMNKTTDQIMNELVKKIKEAANTMGEAVVA